MSDEVLYRQIFFVAKLLQLQAHLFKKLAHCSGGTKRKASIAAALIGAPPLLILDQPTSSLDFAVSRELLLALHYFVHRLGRSLFFTTNSNHDLVLVADSAVELPGRGEACDHRLYALQQTVSDYAKIKVVYTQSREEQVRLSYSTSYLESSSVHRNSFTFATTFTLPQLK